MIVDYNNNNTILQLKQTYLFKFFCFGKFTDIVNHTNSCIETTIWV